MRFLKTYFIALTFVLTAGRCLAADLADIDAYCRKALKDWQVPGFAIAIVQNDEPLFLQGYGVRQLNAPEPVTPNTLFAIASNTKAFTAGAIAILVHEKKLRWDDPVQMHLPWFQLFNDPWISREARIDDLLSHRLGFRQFSGDLIWWNTSYSAEEVVRRARFLKPEAPFRNRIGYSNIGFIAAGEIVAAASGMPWPQFVQTRILNPLEMTNTVLAVRDLQRRSDVASPHGIDDEGNPFPIAWQPWDSCAAAGGVLSSASDLSKWLRAQLRQGAAPNQSLWSPAEAWKMWSLHTPNVFSPASITNDPSFSLTGAGLGWMLADYRGEFLARHGGAYDGMYSHTLLVPKKRFGIVVLSNGMTDLPSSVARYVLDEMIGAPKKDWSAENLKKAAQSRAKKKREQAQDAASRIRDTRPSLPLDHYTGRFGGPMYGNAEITLSSGKLVLKLLPNPDLIADLEHWQHDVFKVTWRKRFAWFGGGKLQFFLAPNSNVAEFKMDIPNDDFWFDELEFKRLSGSP